MVTIDDLEKTLNDIAPPGYAQEWDNVGFLAGDRSEGCRGVLLCIDLSRTVIEEAQQVGANFLLCYHPPIFRPLGRLRADSPGAESLVWRAVRLGMAVYSPHTALDAAPGGTNDVMAGLCDLTDVKPLSYAQSSPSQSKLVVFVPAAAVDKVAEAMFAAGAGWIGQYHHCSFRIPGHGTFWGTPAANPTVGQAGRLETVEEIRLEVVCPSAVLPEVVVAIRATHPYEEPAFDIHPLVPTPDSCGMGRMGRLEQPTTAGQFAERLARAIGSDIAMLAGDASAMVQRVGVVVGSAGRWALEQPRFAGVDVLVTGELKHHEAIAYVNQGKTVIALGHWASERPTLPPLAERIRRGLPGVNVQVSQADRDIWSTARATGT